MIRLNETNAPQGSSGGRQAMTDAQFDALNDRAEELRARRLAAFTKARETTKGGDVVPLRAKRSKTAPAR